MYLYCVYVIQQQLPGFAIAHIWLKRKCLCVCDVQVHEELPRRNGKHFYRKHRLSIKNGMPCTIFWCTLQRKKSILPDRCTQDFCQQSRFEQSLTMFSDFSFIFLFYIFFLTNRNGTKNKIK